MIGSDRASAKLDRQRGFVLPGVLAYITAALAILSIGALALERAQDNAINMQTQVRLTQALDEAEAQLIYYFLTSRSVPYGLAAVEEDFDALGALLGDNVEIDEQTDIWRADGGLRRMQFRDLNVLVSYRDVGGLISLNSSRSEMIAELLESFEVSSEEAQGMVARLKDFIDEDSLRRPRGAERADYRMRGLPAPSNSILRTVSEASSILGWEDSPFLADVSFLGSVTVALTPSEPRAIFAGNAVKEILDDRERSVISSRDVIDEAMSASLLPSGRGQFKLWAYDDHSLRSRLRIVELERTVASINAPYSRTLVYEGPDRVGTELPTKWADAKAFPTIDLQGSDENE